MGFEYKKLVIKRANKGARALAEAKTYKVLKNHNILCAHFSKELIESHI